MFKRMGLLLCMILAMQCIYAGRFNTDYVSQSYMLMGPFAFHTTNNDLYYSINTIPNLDLPPNQLLNLGMLIGDRWPNVALGNGTKLILIPQLAASTNNWTADEAKLLLSTVPYVVIDRENDFITIYIYNTNRYGTKLTFDILAFENFMQKTDWYKNATKNSSDLWEIGFEFYTEETNFDGPPNAQNFLMSQGIRALDIQIYFKNGTAAPTQWLVARIGNTDKMDPKKWDANVLFNNNISYIKDMSTNDVVNVEKILTDAGIKLN